MDVLETILGQMSSVNKAQRNFISIYECVYEANFRNLSRYSNYIAFFDWINYSNISN